MGKKYQQKILVVSFEGIKICLYLSSTILKSVLIHLFGEEEKEKMFFLISKSSISNVNANLINRRER